MNKILKLYTNNPIKREMIPGKILNKRITAEDINLKINSYSEVFNCEKLDKKIIGLRCLNCDCYIEIPIEVFMTRKIKCLVCFSTVGGVLDKSSKTVEELNEINQKYLEGERVWHAGKLLDAIQDGNGRHRFTSDQYRKEIEPILSDGISVVSVPNKQIYPTYFKCEQCNHEFHLKLSYIIHHLIKNDKKVKCAYCSEYEMSKILNL